MCKVEPRDSAAYETLCVCGSVLPAGTQEKHFELEEACTLEA